MFGKSILVFCAQAFFVQLAFSQCSCRSNNLGAGLPSYGVSTPITPRLGPSVCGGPGIAYNGLGYGNPGLGYGSSLAIEVIPTSGGALPVSSSSSITPTGLTVTSENVFEGSLYVTGELPFVSAVALEGVVPSGGAGAASYSCGNGVTAIESIAPAASYGAAGVYGVGGSYGPGFGAFAPTGIAPSSIASGLGAPLSELGCNAGYAPVAEIMAPNRGCGCGGYESGIYY